MYKIQKLKNGINLITVPVAGTKAITVLALFPVGSRYENLSISGASHFVEHMLFKGTAKRPTAQEISRALEAAGADFNAFTSKDSTGYHVKIDASQQELAFDLLADMIFASKFDAAEINKEKGVIVEELRMYEDNPLMAIENTFEQLMFGNCPLGWDIGGTPASVRGLTRDGLLTHYHSAYRPDNMVLVVAGAINAKKLARDLKYFTAVPTATVKKRVDRQSFTPFVWPTKALSLAARVAVKERKVDQAQVVLGFPGIKNNHPDRFALSVLINILGGGMSSRLFTEVREKRGLAYMVRAGAGSFRDCGVVQIQAGLDPARLPEAMQVIREELKKISTVAVSVKELADAKSNFSGRLVLAMEDTHAQADWWARQFWFANKMESHDVVLAKIKKVTASEVLRLAKKLFDWNVVRVAAVGPMKKSDVVKLL